MDFELLLLGTGSAFPTPERFSSAQLLSVHHRLFMFDCGEGAQVRLQQYRAKILRIEAIFISHLHGDHYLGLPGLLDSMALQRRKLGLHLFAPRGLADFLSAHWQNSGIALPFPLHIHEVATDAHRQVFENNLLEVWSIPLRHRLPCAGYMLKEKPRPRNMVSEAIERYGLTVEMIKKLKLGESIQLTDGTTLHPEEATTPAPPSRSFAYCSDTAYLPKLSEMLSGVDLLYHEATFGDDEEHLAATTGHSTARQAAMVARDANVGQLVIGHFSSRYESSEELLNQAREVFSDTLTAYDGMRLSVPLPSRNE